MARHGNLSQGLKAQASFSGSAAVGEPCAGQQQVPIIGRLGFEPTALGVCQATLAILRHHEEVKAGQSSGKRERFIYWYEGGLQHMAFCCVCGATSLAVVPSANSRLKTWSAVQSMAKLATRSLRCRARLLPGAFVGCRLLETC